MSRHLQLTALALVALVAGACGADGEPAATDEPVEEAAPDEPEPADEAEPEADPDPAPGDATVAVGTTEHGEVLVDADGFTLYVFDVDEQGPSACDGDCAANWPPLVVDDEPSAGAGVEAALLGTAPRADGSTQVTYGGWPLYRWVGDDAPGDATGQAVQDVWWVVGPDGTVLRDDDEPAGAGGMYDY